MIISMSPSDGTYKACYNNHEGEDRMVKVVCWALVEVTLPNDIGEPVREFYRVIRGMVLGKSGVVDAETVPGFCGYRETILTK